MAMPPYLYYSTEFSDFTAYRYDFLYYSRDSRKNLYYSYYFAWQLSSWIRTEYNAKLYFLPFVRFFIRQEHNANYQ